MLFRIFVTAIVIVACFFLYQVYGYRYVLDDIRNNAPTSTIMGPEIAPINIVAYLDYGSSWSRRAHPVLLQILSQNPDVNMIIKPYAGVSEQSEFVTRLALAAIEDNMFLDVHGIVIDAPEGLSKDYIKKAMQLRGLNYDELVARAYSPNVDEMISGIKKEALLLSVNKTPHIFIENVSLEGGGYSFPEIEDIVKDVRVGRR
jgi:protein-disulfide isomerase